MYFREPSEMDRSSSVVDGLNVTRNNDVSDRCDVAVRNVDDLKIIGSFNQSSSV